MKSASSRATTPRAARSRSSMLQGTPRPRSAAAGRGATDDGPARRDRDTSGAALDEQPLVNGREGFRPPGRLVRQQSRHERGHEVHVMRQQREAAVLPSAVTFDTGTSSSTDVGSEDAQPQRHGSRASSTAPIM
jgi:hypothetical protein